MRPSVLYGSVQTLVVAMICATLVSVSPPSARAAAEVELGPGDRITITVRGQPDFSGEFELDAAGRIRIPFVGPIDLRGRSISDARASVRSSLANGFIKEPHVDVRVSELRPVYVTGGVRAPGRYPFRPGSSVMMVIAEAGGLGTANTNPESNVVDLIASEQRVSLLRRQRIESAITIARIDAELEKRETIDRSRLAAPGSGADNDDAEERLAREEGLLKASLAAYRQTIEAMKGEKALLEGASVEINKAVELKRRQLELTRRRLKLIGSRVKQGYATLSTELALERDAAQLQIDIANLQRSVLQNRRDAGQLNASIQRETTARRARLLAERDRLAKQLSELELELPAAQRTLNWRRMQSASVSDNRSPLNYLITIARAGSDGRVVVMPADPNARIRPGDMIDVRLDLRVPGRAGVSPAHSGSKPASALRDHAARHGESQLERRERTVRYQQPVRN